MSPTKNNVVTKEQAEAIKAAREAVTHAESRGNFDSAHHQVLKNLLQAAGIEESKEE